MGVPRPSQVASLRRLDVRRAPDRAAGRRLGGNHKRAAGGRGAL
ncbi:hypothetical protein LCGC14_2029770, partial [marine sediment metagenome]